MTFGQILKAGQRVFDSLANFRNQRRDGPGLLPVRIAVDRVSRIRRAIFQKALGLVVVVAAQIFAHAWRKVLIERFLVHTRDVQAPQIATPAEVVARAAGIFVSSSMLVCIGT